jgi:pyrroloquinoline-quinone synthase
MAALLSKDEFRTALQDAIKGREAKNASFSQAWADGKLKRHHFARWAENHYHYVGPFADYLGYIYANTPDENTFAKDFLLQNMYEEELADIRHTDLLIRFAEACGTTRAQIEDPNSMNAVTRGLQAWCYAMAMREHFVVATAALVVGLESQVPSIYKKQIVPLREVYGFTEDEIEFFSLHITSDEVHGERGYQIVLDNATTPELQQRCLQFVRWGAEMRFAYTKALYDTYVAPDEDGLAPVSAGTEGWGSV